MSRIVVVSNRLPVTVNKSKEKLSFQQSVGGLATGMSSFQENYQCLWVGWPGVAREKIASEERNEIITQLDKMGSYPVFLSHEHIEDYYNGFSNKTIWPLFHCFNQYTVYDNHLWDVYKRVNQIFCQTVLDIIKPDDILWIHDYHLLLLPQLLRKRMPDLTIGFFLHIPFPPTEIFRLLPWRKEILEGIMGSDLVGFHTYDYVRNFLDSVLRLRGYENNLGFINHQNRLVKIDSFPMGIDFDRFYSASDHPETMIEIEKIKKEISSRKIIISVDRLDYTKGILERLKAFSTFLEDNPEYWEKVTMILVAVPSRTDVSEYQKLKHHVDEMIGHINGKFGKMGWSPIWYFYRSMPFPLLTALYYIADIALITPLKDGMNLIAKEYIAAKKDSTGVLILSEMAGAGNEMGEALIVNPNNQTQISWALKYALSMGEEEKKKRIKVLQERIKNYDVKKWAEDFKEKLLEIKERQSQLSAKYLSPKNRLKIIKAYKESKKRLFLIDYDGTLIPRHLRFKQTHLSKEVIQTINLLNQDSKNKVVIVSGREKRILESWFKKMEVDLIAEHGAWLRKGLDSWRTIEPLQKEWKNQIRPILELYVNRTPGSFIQEKEFSLIWHYSNTDPAFGNTRAMEIMDSLTHLTANLDLEISHGDKVIEIKTTGVNKGYAAYQWISDEDWDFILAIGDDWSDESTFSYLPDNAFSIRVGHDSSESNFNIHSSTEVRALLKELTLKTESSPKEID